MTEEEDAPPRQLPPGIGYIWERLAAEVERRIKTGDWSYGDRLPAREDLAAEYGVGERTVRRALRELGKAGLVEVLPSKGAFVSWAGHGGAHEGSSGRPKTN